MIISLFDALPKEQLNETNTLHSETFYMFEVNQVCVYIDIIYEYNVFKFAICTIIN